MNIERTSTEDLSFSLRGTGMNLSAQMEMIKQTRSETKNISEWKDTVINKNRSDLEGLYWEYLTESGVLPFRIEIRDHHVVCPDYGGKLLTDVVSDDEREGSIYKSVALIEQNLLNSQKADTHVLISPPGWSGYDEPHKTAQIYFYQKQGDSINSMTFVSRTATLSDCVNFATILTGETIVDTNLTEKQQILSFTSQPLSFIKLSPHEVVDALEVATNSNLMQMHDLLDNRPRIHHGVQQCISDLEHFIRTQTIDDSTESLFAIQQKLGQTVLDMESVLTRGRKPQNKKEYEESLRTFSEHEGCNGGGTIYSRGSAELSEEEEFPNWGFCALKAGCMSEKRGQEQQLGLCMICKTCDRAFRSGRSESEIRSIAAKSQPVTNQSGKMRNNEQPIFIQATLAFIGALFSA